MLVRGLPHDGVGDLAPKRVRPSATEKGVRLTHPSQYILGISAFYHDSAACLLRDGEIVAAAQEERFTRKKGDASYPANAVAYCLREGGIHAEDLAYVGSISMMATRSGRRS